MAFKEFRARRERLAKNKRSSLIFPGIEFKCLVEDEMIWVAADVSIERLWWGEEQKSNLKTDLPFTLEGFAVWMSACESACEKARERACEKARERERETSKMGNDSFPIELFQVFPHNKIRWINLEQSREFSWSLKNQFQSPIS